MTRLCSGLVLLTTLWCAACTGEPAPPADDGGAGESGTAGSGSGGKSSTLPADCPDGPALNDAPAPLDVGTVTAQFVDEQGEPTSVGRVQVCGIDICRDVTAATTETGKLIKVLGEPLDAPACKFGNGQDWAELLVPIAAGDNALGTLMTARLPDYAGAERLEAGKSVSSAGLTLTLAADAQVEANTLDYETEEEQQSLRAVELPEQALAQLNQDFVVGYGLAPLDTVICPSPAVSLKNTANLEPGRELDLFVLGLNAGGHFAPYGQWQKVGTGQVSDDGKTLEFADGIPVLSALAVRIKP